MRTPAGLVVAAAVMLTEGAPSVADPDAAVSGVPGN
jgi:hypothetical protein